jgi:hypothetical protein
VTCGSWCFSPAIPVSSTNETDHHDQTEILLKVALNTINQPTNHMADWLLVPEDIIHPVAKVFRHWHGLLDLSIIEIYSS